MSVLCKHLLSIYFIHFPQTVFIISVCNNQLLDWIENELIWLLSLIPGFDAFLPTLTAKLHAVKEKYLTTPPPVPSNIKVVLNPEGKIYPFYPEFNLTSACSGNIAF